MSNTFTLNQLQNNIFSSLNFNGTNDEPRIIQSIAIGGEVLHGGEMDYLWVRIFSRLNAGAFKQKEDASRFKKKVKYKSADFTASANILKGIYLARKTNWCILQTKDPMHIKRIQAPSAGFYKVRMHRCEKYAETKRLARYWRRYLEDVKLTYEVSTTTNQDLNYVLDFYSLRLFDVDA